MDLTLTYLELNFRKKSISHISVYYTEKGWRCVCVCVSPSIFYTIDLLLSFAYVLLVLLSNISAPGDTYNMHC